MAPITLKQSLSVGDILDASRCTMFFPSLPGLASGVKYQTALTLTQMAITVPERRIGQIRVPLYGSVLAFRGQKDNGNSFQASFADTSDGDTSYTLLAWSEAASSSEDDSSAEKRNYAVDTRLEFYDTTGAPALIFNFLGVWPVSVIPPQPSIEGSSPARAEVTFSVDFIDLVFGGRFTSVGTGFLDSGGETQRGFIPQSGSGYNNRNGYQALSTTNSAARRLTMSEFGSLVGGLA